MSQSTGHFDPQPHSFWNDVDFVIKKMTYEDLKILHDKVADQISFVRDSDVFIAKVLLRIGDKVSFSHNGHTIVGIVTKKNPKTVLVRSDDQRLWKVHPPLLSRVIT